MKELFFVILAGASISISVPASAEYRCQATMIAGVHKLIFVGKRLRVATWTVQPRISGDGSIEFFVQEEGFVLLPDGRIRGRGGSTHSCDLEKVRAELKG